LAAGLKSAADTAGFPSQMQRMGSMMTLFFNDAPVIDWPSANRSDRKRFGKYFWGLMEEGVYMPCSQFEALFFSRTHRPEDIEQTIDAAHRVLAKMD
jgi:glutamate-1-semialdehyde 2,1-aminomutase